MAKFQNDAYGKSASVFCKAHDGRKGGRSFFGVVKIGGKFYGLTLFADPGDDSRVRMHEVKSRRDGREAFGCWVKVSVVQDRSKQRSEGL